MIPLKDPNNPCIQLFKRPLIKKTESNRTTLPNCANSSNLQVYLLQQQLSVITKEIQEVKAEIATQDKECLEIWRTKEMMQDQIDAILEKQVQKGRDTVREYSRMMQEFLGDAPKEEESGDWEEDSTQ